MMRRRGRGCGHIHTVIPQTPSMVLTTYRPDYRGALTRLSGAHTIALAPLDDSEASTLVSELLGPDPSIGGLAGASTRMVSTVMVGLL